MSTGFEDFESIKSSNYTLNSNNFNNLDKYFLQVKNENININYDEMIYEDDGVDINWEEHMNSAAREAEKVAKETAKRLAEEEKAKEERQQDAEEAISALNDGVTFDELETAIIALEALEVNGELDENSRKLLEELKEQKELNNLMFKLNDGATKEEIESLLNFLKGMDASPDRDRMIRTYEETLDRMEKWEKANDALIKYAEEPTLENIDVAISALEDLTQNSYIKEELSRLYRRKDEMTLEELYIERGENNGLFNPDKEERIEREILDLEKKLNVPHRRDGLEQLMYDPLGTAVTFVASVGEGALGVLEDAFDGAVMIGGHLVSAVVGIVDDEAAEQVKKAAQTVVEYDASGKLYDSFVVDFLGIPEDIAKGPAHTAGNFVGEAGATIALQFIPGGTSAMVAAHTFKGIGAAAQSGFENNPDASFDDVLEYSYKSGFIEGASSYLLYGKTGGEKVVDILGGKVSSAVGKMMGLDPFKTVNVMNGSSIVKVGIAGAKEYAKEYASVSVDGEFDWDAANSNAARAMTIQTGNEILVGNIKNTQASADVKNKNISDAYDSIDDLSVADKSGLGVSSDTTEKALQSVIDENQLTFSEKLVDKYVRVDTSSNAFSYASKVIKKGYDKIGEEIQDFFESDES